MINSKKGKVKGLETEAQAILSGANQVLKKEVRRWPALVALVAIGGAYTILSERLTVGPSWLLFVLMLLLAVPAIITRLNGNHKMNHYLLLALCILVTLAELVSIILLLLSLPDKSISAVSLLRDAGLLWGTNIVVFALWYWQTDAGGPYGRSHMSSQEYRQQATLLFPQLTMVEQRPAFGDWHPKFIDYLFVAFNTSTAFSPTDTPVLTTRIKILSMVQAVLSLVTLATLAARAINIL